MLRHLLDSPYRAFIFDCDGTIGDTMGIYFHGWNWALREMDGPAQLDWADFCACGGRCFRKTIQEYNQRNDCTVDGDIFCEKLNEYMEKNLHHFRPIRPVLELIIAEKERPMAVASAGLRRNVHYILNRLGIFDRFGGVVTQEDVVRDGIARVKPDPDLFLLAAEKLGVKPETCLVFEDSPVGIEAAGQAGMAVQRIPMEWWDPWFRSGDWDSQTASGQ